MQADFIELFRLAKDAHERCYTLLAQKCRAFVNTNSDIQELTDLALACRESHRLIHDLRTELYTIQEVASKKATKLWVDAGQGEPIRTEYCTATPDLKMMVRLPTRKGNPVEYAKMMEYLGIPQAMYYSDSDRHISPVVDVHYVGMVEHISQLASEGKPLPPGCDPSTQYPVFTLVLRKRREVDE